MITKQHILDKYAYLFKRLAFGIDVGDGWLKLVDTLCESITNYIHGYNITHPDDIIEINVVQIKEKFGGLRFYTDVETAEISGMIWMAESMSEHICEDCGDMKTAEVRDGSWLKSLCDQCYEEDIKQGKEWNEKMKKLIDKTLEDKKNGE